MAGQPSAFGFGGANGAGASNGMPGAQRRSTMQPQGLVGMGGMGGSARPPGKSGLTFDHILSRLQGELQKSRETGAELHSLTNAMNDIHETLGGNIVRPPFHLYLHGTHSCICSHLRYPHIRRHYLPSSLHNNDTPSHLPLRRLDRQIHRRRSANCSLSCMKPRSRWLTTWKRFVHWRVCWLSMSLSRGKCRRCET